MSVHFNNFSTVAVKILEKINYMYIMLKKYKLFRDSKSVKVRDVLRY